MLSFFQGLRGKLTLTYTLVTVLALLALEVLIIAFGILMSSLMRSDLSDYLSDVIYTLYPQASDYLQPGDENLPGLQAWLEGVYTSGYASLEPQNWTDSAVAPIVKSDTMYVLSPEGIVLAQAPRGENDLIGRRYVPPDRSSQTVINYAKQGQINSLQLYTTNAAGKYYLAVPVMQEGMRSPLVGVIVLTVEPPPPRLLAIWPVILSTVLGTAVVLLVGVAPFGTLFGYIMSRSLTRRLHALSQAADAWSEGDFRPVPLDRSRDEIGQLGMRLRNMAERVQSLVQSQHELAMLEERNRLARELHDTVKQQTFATLMQVRAAKNLLTSDPETARQFLDEAEGLLKTSQQELGRMIAEMRPAALDGQGLPAALRGYLDHWSHQTRIPAELQVQNERKLPLETEQALYRVAQEALSNVARHSRASAVNLRLSYEPKQVCLEITDNGVGFTTKGETHSGFGLQSMRERLTALNGELVIESSTESGTRLSATIHQ